MSNTRKVGGTVRHIPDVAWRDAGDGMERAVVFEPGFNDPTPHGHGKHGMAIRFLLRGPKGVTQFLMNTGWVPGEKGIPATLADYYPSGWDVGDHSAVPQFEGAEEYGLNESCEYMRDRAACYYDGSTLAADALLRRFIVEGDEAVWEVLCERYDGLMADGEVRP